MGLTNFIKSNLAINRIKLAKGIAGRALKDGEEVFKDLGKYAKGSKDYVSMRDSRQALKNIVNGSVKDGSDAVKHLNISNYHNIERADRTLKSKAVFGGKFEKQRAVGLTYGSMAKEYFWTGANKTQRIARIGTATGGYLGANALLRCASGGSLTRNNRGESDIAGIPLL